MILTIFLFVLFALILIWIGSSFAKSSIPVIVLGWFLKCLAGIGFIYVYTYHYGNGKLSEDSGAYMQEAEMLVAIKNNKPADFYAILWNKKNNEELIADYFKSIPNSRISRQVSGINDTRIHIKTISLLMVVFNGNKYAVFIFLLFISYLGIILLWLTLKDRIRLNPTASLLLLLLPPNLLFWTSSNLKEPIYVLGLCLIFTYMLTIKKNRFTYIFGLVGILFVLLFKPILLAILISGWVLYRLYEGIFIKKQIVYPIGIGISILLLIWFSIPTKMLNTLSDKQFDFINIARGGIQIQGDTCFYYISSNHESQLTIRDSMVVLKKPIPVVSNLFGKIRNEKKLILYPNQENLKVIYRQEKGGSYFEITFINKSWTNFFIAIPEALRNTLFRPFFWHENQGKISIFLFFENIFFFILLILLVLKSKKLFKNFPNTLITSFLTIASLVIIIGITTPISGALIRYRIPIHLLIIIVFLLTTIKHERAE